MSKLIIEQMRSEGKTVKEIYTQLGITKGEYYKILKSEVLETTTTEIIAEQSIIEEEGVVEDVNNNKIQEDSSSVQENEEVSEVELEEDISEDLEIVRFEDFHYIEGTTCKLGEVEHIFESKTKMFMYMCDVGLTVSEVKKLTGSHPSFIHGAFSKCFNVGVKSSTPRIKEETKSDKVRVLLAEGKTVKEVAKIMEVNYSFVFGVCKRKSKSLIKTVD